MPTTTPAATPIDPSSTTALPTSSINIFNPFGASNFVSNPVAAGNTKDAASWYQSKGYTWTPQGWQPPLYGPYSAGGAYGGVGAGALPYGTSEFSTGSMYGTPSAYPNRALPSWMAPMGQVTKESQQMFKDVPGLFNTGPYQQAVNESIGRISTTARNAASNAAAEYAARARQAGGSQLGAGLVKAEGMVGAEKTVGDVRTQAAQYVLEQQEKQATLSSQIADQLGTLRNNYLSTLAGYATSEDKFQASLGAGARGAGSGAGIGGGSGNNWWMQTPEGEGASLGVKPIAFNAGMGLISQPTSTTDIGSKWNLGGPGMG